MEGQMVLNVEFGERRKKQLTRIARRWQQRGYSRAVFSDSTDLGTAEIPTDEPSPKGPCSLGAADPVTHLQAKPFADQDSGVTE